MSALAYILSYMVNQSLIDVVKNQLAGGIGEQEIREFLRRRGTTEDEVREIFEILSPDAPALREIPIVESSAVPVDQPIEKRVTPSVPEVSVAHGVVREVPPLSPSVPFAATVADQSIPAEVKTVPINTSSGIVLPPIPNRRRQIAIGIFIAAGALLIGGGIYVYSTYFASPDKVMDAMISNVRDVRSFAFSGELAITTNEAASLTSAISSAENPFTGILASVQGPVTFTLKASGVFDALDERRPKISAIFDATIDKWALGDFAFDIEYRNLDRNNYIKINALPDAGFLSLSFLKNTWFMIQDKEAKEQLGAPIDSSDIIVPTATQEQRDQLRDAWQSHRFLTVVETFPSEDIDGVSTHHYALAFDKEAFKAWITTTDAIMQQEPTDQRELEESLSAMTIRTMEVWIGKRDRLPHKVLLQASIQDVADSSKVFDLTFTAYGKDFNTPMDVVAPEGAKSFEEVLRGVFAQMLGSGSSTTTLATPQARNDQRKKDISILADAIKKNMADNGDVFSCAAGPFPRKATFLGSPGFGSTGYAIEFCLVPKYLDRLPKDPTKGVLGMTGYSAYYDPKTKKVTVRAPYAEGGVKISITK